MSRIARSEGLGKLYLNGVLRTAEAESMGHRRGKLYGLVQDMSPKNYLDARNRSECDDNV
jgi:hypothetical protein